MLFGLFYSLIRSIYWLTKLYDITFDSIHDQFHVHPVLYTERLCLIILNCSLGCFIWPLFIFSDFHYYEQISLIPKLKSVNLPILFNQYYIKY